MLARFVLAVLFAVVTVDVAAADATPQSPAAAKDADPRAVMTGDKVVQILDETVDWYRMLGIQQQAATQPSDLLILYANRQTAEKVMALAFEIARANAELLASEAGAAQASEDAASSQSLSGTQKKLDAERTSIQAEIDTAKRELAAGKNKGNANLQARVSVLQGELDLLNARRNMLSNMTQYAAQNDTNGFGANSLKAHIDAIAASIPSALPAPTPAQPAPAQESDSDSGALSLVANTSLTRFGIWDLTSTVLRLAAKARTIDAVNDRTAELQKVLDDIRNPPLERLKALSARADALAAQADAGDKSGAELKAIRDRYDTVAWLFQQTSAIVIPLNKVDVLLKQYQRNLRNWRDATDKQYRDALGALGWRLALFGGLLVLVFVIADLWRRAVFRYVHDTRRRSRLLLLRKIVFWVLVIVIAAATFATELSSLATFAGLITAGLAVAMQSVLVSVVGYFFLIGKYGIRVGDRVQIGSVTGEVIDLGLVRLHLMELSGDGPMAPTGRVVAFANSIIFGASGGLFKQIPGVNLAWHEIALVLPAGADFTTLKDRLTAAAVSVIQEYHEDIVKQTQAIQKTASGHAVSEVQPQVQLRFSAASVDAVVRYPVQLQHAAEIDERMSRELLAVLSMHDASPPRIGSEQR
ncbi:MAG: mechanosensitive ion channel family protein [Gammaproteobacteria bacterium]